MHSLRHDEACLSGSAMGEEPGSRRASKMAALEQVRDIFDHGEIGLVLIGIPGIEKRLALYPQLYSRVGFVHAFRPLSAVEVRDWLQHPWTRIVLLAGKRLDDAAVAAIIR